MAKRGDVLGATQQITAIMLLMVLASQQVDFILPQITLGEWVGLRLTTILCTGGNNAKTKPRPRWDAVLVSSLKFWIKAYAARA